MSEIEVRNAMRQMFFQEILEGLLERVPKSSTKQACKILGCSTKWLLNNKDLFKTCIVKDKRGTLQFDTMEVLQFKIRKQLN